MSFVLSTDCRSHRTALSECPPLDPAPPETYLELIEGTLEGEDSIDKIFRFSRRREIRCTWGLFKFVFFRRVRWPGYVIRLQQVVKKVDE